MRISNLYQGVLSLHQQKMVQTIGLVMLAFVVALSVAVAPATPAKAATCGGSIVTYTTTYNGHYAIFVSYNNPKDLNNIPNGLSRVDFNGTQPWWWGWKTVPNGQNGVDYSTPLRKVGRQGFLFGVSTRWAVLNANNTWTDASRWRVYYSC